MHEKKLVVIGSNSFSGSHFVDKALNYGYEVMGISRSEEPLPIFLPYRWIKNKNEISENIFIFKKFDLNQHLDSIIRSIDTFEPSYIVNFAAQGMVAESWMNPTHWYKTNVVSQVALHDELRKKEYLEKYVHVTTPEVYGSTDRGWIDEKTNFSPSTPYAVSRAACDLHLQSFYQAYKFPVTFTRAANVYGPGQQLYRIIPRTILSALSGKKMKLHGGGLSTRCFIHIDDVVEATLKIMTNASPGTSWHLSNREEISIRNLVEKICELCDVNFSKIVDISEERLGKDQSYLLNSNAIREAFKWEEKIDLISGIKETINWIDCNYDLLCKLPWDYVHKI
ncbi:NAD-dependent epimerase/dehydratase family protein [Prochlorococcus marinus XMU1412]|uniref:GDP-mannose 4,6-dehydratase n=1 Tax=Prochlorococcus marinus TaxID=1219 RepID=UPI001ADA91A8|nr:GDP-mannose 4,6-dehydratase [Prochlorococcus marinus]MBO8240510.1 NAD-dependent epimerase/dehydratase family protein [Prochlorococcus marinus XMU1412]MBW3071744.1 dTDP-glucose 4,6-dehydratase [Prochlorococcus marinus str. MU1412]